LKVLRNVLLFVLAVNEYCRFLAIIYYKRSFTITITIYYRSFRDRKTKVPLQQ